MIDFSSKTFSNILFNMLQRVPGDINKRDGSLVKTSLAPAAWVHEGLYLDLALIQKQAFGGTATGEDLDAIVYMAGLQRKQPTKTVWIAEFNLQPDIGTVFVARDYDGTLKYDVSTSSVKNDETGLYECRLECETPGTVGNTYSGFLVPETFLPGLVHARLKEIAVNGESIETDDALRERWEAEIIRDKFTGNVLSYKNVVSAVDDVGRCVVFPTWNGPGTVCLSLLDMHSEPVSEDTIAEVKNMIDPETSGNGLGYAPIGAHVTVKTPQKKELAITATVRLNAGKTIAEATSEATVGINEYMRRLRDNFDNSERYRPPKNTVVYVNEVLSIIQLSDSVETVVGNVRIDGRNSDVVLQHSGAAQYLPYLGSITLNSVSEGT